MYDLSEKTWFNQDILICYGKLVDEINSTLTLTIGTYTKDFLQYSVPTLLIRIYDPSKSVNINIDRCQARKLLNSINYSFEKKNGVYQINLGNKRKAKIGFRKSGDGLEVVFGIINDIKESIVVMTISDLEEVKETIKSYLSICTEIACQGLFYRKEIHQQTGILRTLPSQISPVNISSKSLNMDNNQITVDIDLNSTEDKDTINDEFSKYLDSDKIENIELEVPENNTDLETGKNKNEKKTIFYGSIVQTLLKNDISELEKLCSVLVTSENPFFSLLHTMSENISLEEYNINDLSPKDKFLPGINENQLKAVLYISRVSYFRIMDKLLKSKPGSLSVVPIETSYYIPKDISVIKDYNKNISIDILLLISYLRESYKNLIQSEGNIHKNKILLYSQFRLLFDPLMISFIKELDPTSTINELKGRYNQYKEDGFFKSFEEDFSRYKCNEPNVNNIINFAEKVLTKLQSDNNEAILKISKGENRDRFVLNNSNINKYTFEQITREITRLEVNAPIERSDISKEVLELFGYVTLPSNETIIGRFAREHMEEISEDIKNDFLLELNDNCKNNKYDFVKNKDKFSLDKIGDTILIALWIWDPINADIESKDYNSFMEMFRAFAEGYETSDSINNLRSTILDLYKEDSNEKEPFYEAITEDISGLF